MAPARTIAALLLTLSGCAITPSRTPATPAPATTQPQPRPASVPIELTSAASPPPGDPSIIGRATIEEARALLSRARNQLEVRQWKLLDTKLTEAERAFERFEAAARTSGRAAHVARGMKGVAEAGRGMSLA
jgi:hypothetical protein